MSLQIRNENQHIGANRIHTNGLSGTDPSVSVIMPVYNQEKYMAAAVSSILQQTFTDYELLIVDDGSTDRTVEIIESFKDQRIRLIRTEHKGFIEALRVATAEARGKWLARMDSDDICRPERLEKQLDFLAAHPECLFVTTYYGIVTLNNKYLAPSNSSKWHYLSPSDISLASKPFCDPGTIFDREHALEIGYDEEFNWEKTLWYGLLTKGKGAVMEEPLYFIRYRMGSVSRGQNSYPIDMSFKMRSKYDKKNAQQAENDLTAKINLKNEKKCVYYYCVAGDYSAARKIAFQTWLQFPFNLETIKLMLISFGLRSPQVVRGPGGIELFPASSAL